MSVTLTDLPPGVLHLIGEQIFDNGSLSDPTGRDGASSSGDSQRSEDLRSLVALSETSQLLRFTVGPLAFWHVRLRSREDISEVVESDWAFDIEKLSIPMSEFDVDESNCWADALLLFNLLRTLPKLKHLSLRVQRSFGHEMTLAILSTLLDPPPVPHILMTSNRAIPSLIHLESFDIVFEHNENTSCHGHFLEALFPLLDQFSGLKNFSLSHFAEQAHAPQLQPLLPHLPKNLERLTLLGEFQESVDVRRKLMLEYCPNVRQHTSSPASPTEIEG